MSVPTTHRIYFIPGMFGFGELAGYDYFAHMERALTIRFRRYGAIARTFVVPAPPTASIRRRAAVTAQMIHRTCGDAESDPIHIIGHSTGGLDARLLASPTVSLDLPKGMMRWRPRLASIVSMDTPHYGTPLAQFFATVSGTRLLHALSLFTVATLTVGGPSLTLISNLIATVSKIDDFIGWDIDVFDRLTEMLLNTISHQKREEVRAWAEDVKLDQGGIIQIAPESLDLFNAVARDADDVRYGCVVASAPPPKAWRLAATTVRAPFSLVSSAIFSMLHTVASRVHPHYPYPEPGLETASQLRRALQMDIGPRLTDGVVPTLSMLWGELVWVGIADHLDIVGHFADDHRTARHIDWLRSGSGFGRRRFFEMVSAVTAFLLQAA